MKTREKGFREGSMTFFWKTGSKISLFPRDGCRLCRARRKLGNVARRGGYGGARERTGRVGG